MSDLDLSVFNRDVLVQVGEMLQFLRENEYGIKLEYHLNKIMVHAPIAEIDKVFVHVRPTGMVTKVATSQSDLITVIARAMLALEAMNE